MLSRLRLANLPPFQCAALNKMGAGAEMTFYREQTLSHPTVCSGIASWNRAGEPFYTVQSQLLAGPLNICQYDAFALPAYQRGASGSLMAHLGMRASLASQDTCDWLICGCFGVAHYPDHTNVRPYHFKVLNSGRSRISKAKAQSLEVFPSCEQGQKLHLKGNPHSNFSHYPSIHSGWMKPS